MYWKNKRIKLAVTSIFMVALLVSCQKLPLKEVSGNSPTTSSSSEYYPWSTGIDFEEALSYWNVKELNRNCPKGQKKEKIVIVGGGPNGLTAAIEAYSKCYKVVLVEKRLKYERENVLILTANKLNGKTLESNTMGRFKKLGLKDSVEEEFIPPVTGLDRFSISETGRNKVLARNLVRIRDLEELLAARVQKCALDSKDDFEVFYGYEVNFNKKPKNPKSSLVIQKTLDPNKEILLEDIDLVVAADGKNSAIRNHIQVPLHILSDKGYAIIAIFDKNDDMKNNLPKGNYSFPAKFDGIRKPITRFFSSQNQVYVAQSLDEFSYENIEDGTQDPSGLLTSITQKHSEKYFNVQPKSWNVLEIRIQAAESPLIVRDNFPPVYLVGDAFYTGHLLSGSVFNQGNSSINLELAIDVKNKYLKDPNFKPARPNWGNYKGWMDSNRYSNRQDLDRYLGAAADSGVEPAVGFPDRPGEKLIAGWPIFPPDLKDNPLLKDLHKPDFLNYEGITKKASEIEEATKRGEKLSPEELIIDYKNYQSPQSN